MIKMKENTNKNNARLTYILLHSSLKQLQIGTELNILHQNNLLIMEKPNRHITLQLSMYTALK